MKTKRVNEANIEAVASQIGGTLLPNTDQCSTVFKLSRQRHRGNTSSLSDAPTMFGAVRARGGSITVSAST